MTALNVKNIFVYFKNVITNVFIYTNAGSPHTILLNGLPQHCNTTESVYKTILV